MPADATEALLAAGEFALGGPVVSIEPFGAGHINDTFRLRAGKSGQERRYVLQRINGQVFPQPDRLMENMVRVCAHARTKLGGAADGHAGRRTLRLIPTRTGRQWLVDAGGQRWRCLDYVEGTTGFDVVREPAQAYEAARAFGAFQALMSDLPGDRLHETIPDFHHTPSRYARFLAAVEHDIAGRVGDSGPEIAFARSRAAEVAVITDGLADGSLPERITHNDAKLGNVLLDDVTHEGVCVVDLDTVMPGSPLYDFGDLVRTSSSSAQEDERDLSLVRVQLPMFEALVRGYLSTAGVFLTPREKALLPFAGKLITFETGLRFLTDWLEGDRYFKTHRDGHNLDRARTQFALVASIEMQMPAMQALVEQS